MNPIISVGFRRSWTLLVALGVVAAMSPGAARAALIAYEPFDYPVGSSVFGQSGGLGWTSPWRQQLSMTIPVHSNFIGGGSLTAPSGLPTRGNHGVFTGVNGTLQIARSFPNIAGTDGTTTWISYLGQRIGQATDANNPNGNAWPNNPYPRSANLSFYDTQGLAQSVIERIGIGNSTSFEFIDPNHYDEWSIMPRGLRELREGPPNHSPSTAQLVWAVLRIDHVGNHLTPDSAWLWIDPDPLVEPAKASADVTVLSGDANSSDYSHIDYVRPFMGGPQNESLINGFPASNWRPAAAMLIDEIRIGTTYADMRAVPEPATGALLSLAGLSLLGRRRRKSRGRSR